MDDIKLNYDTEASGPFTLGETLTFGGGGVAELVLLYDEGATGEMYCKMISGSNPLNNETITGGSSSATALLDGNAFVSRFPVKIAEDTSYTASSGNIRWTGPNLGTTHSCKFDGQTVNLTLGEILTFGNGSTAELIEQTDSGGSGELFFRMISVTPPADNDTISGGTSSGDGNVDGAVHTRAYTPNNLHYWFADKGDDATFVGNDEQDRTKPRISQRVGVTDVLALGSANIDDTMSYHMYSGSWVQGGGSPTEYNAVAIAVVDADGSTEPVIIQSNALLSATTTEYWKNAYMPNAASRINMLIKVNVAGTVTDRRVVRFRALEYLRNYFTAPDPTLSGGITPVSLVATDDGNNSTAAATVATWSDAIFTYGYATVDHNNGNGAQPYWAVGDIASRTKPQFHERYKWVQRRGTSETILGLNAQLIVGNDLTFNFDGESGTDITHGDILTFSGNSTGTALVLGVNYATGTTGELYCQRLTGDVPLDDAVITSDGGGTAVVNGTPVDRLIINNLFGSFTGTAFNPANIGLTLEAADADTSDLYTDLLEAQQQPPNNQTGTINTAISNVVTVYPWDGAATDAVGDPAPDFVRLATSVTLSGASETQATVTGSIPTWVPQVGFARITTDAGVRRIVPYSSWSGSVFTFTSNEDFSGDNATSGNGLMPSPIDQVVVSASESFTGVYTANQNKAADADQQFVVRVTNASGATAKQPATNTATFTSGGFSLNVTLIND